MQEKKHFILKPFEEEQQQKFRVEVEISLSKKKQLEIYYSIVGNMQHLFLPPLEKEKKRVIGLWESTCFELFIKENLSSNYFELNFSPEGHWNCFYFKKPRDYITPYPVKKPPLTDVASNLKKEGFYQIKIQFDLHQLLKNFNHSQSIDIGISTIVLDQKKMSYWALGHFQKKPDFHDFKSFMHWNLKEEQSH